MSYGFKFTNTNGELVVDDSNVKPWYINGSIAGTTNYFGMNYKNVDVTYNAYDFGIFNPNALVNDQPSTNNSSLYGPNGTWHIYELRYIAPNISDCFYAYTLPRSNDSNIWYFTQDVGINQASGSTAGAGPIHLLNNPKTDVLPTPGTGDQYVSIFAMVPDAWAATATAQQLQATVPKVYFFSNKEIGNNILSNGYGMQVFDPTAKCMYDSAKIHIQFKSYSFQDWSVPAPPGINGPDYNGANIASNFITTASTPSNTAFVIPTIIQYYYRIESGSRGVFDIYRTMVQRIDSGSDTGNSSTIKTRTVKVTSQTTESLGLGTTVSGLNNGTWWNYGTNSYTGYLTGQQYKTSILALDSAPLDRGYTASDWPSTFVLSANKTTVTESSVNNLTNRVTFTLTTTRVASGYQGYYSAYTISGTGITANDIDSVYVNGTYAGQGSLSGYFTVVNNIGTISLDIKEDYIAEGTETLTLSLNSGLSSVNVSLTDSAPTYSLNFVTTPDSTDNGIPQFRETGGNGGGAITFTLKTNNVAIGTTVPWELVYSGNFNSSDIVPSYSAPLTIEAVSVQQAIISGYNGTASTAFVLRADNSTEGVERGRIRLTNNPSVYLDFDILDTSIGNPTYAIYNPFSVTSGSVYLDEGYDYTWSIQTTNLPNGTRVFPKINYNTATAADLVLSYPAGGSGWVPSDGVPVTVDTSGTGYVQFRIGVVADVLFEGLQNFTVSLEYPLGTNVLTYNGTVYINDTSKPPEEYTVTVDSGEVVEGGVVVVTFTSSLDYAHPTTWTLEGVNLGIPNSRALTLSDISSMRYEDPDYTISGGPRYTNIATSSSGSFSFPTSGILTSNLRYKLLITTIASSAADPKRYAQIYNRPVGGVTGNIIGLAGFFVVDPAATYNVTPRVTSVNEGSQLIWDITTTGVADGTVLYWIDLGTNVSADYVDNTYGGSITINNNSATITRTVSADGVYEGAETSQVNLFRNSDYSGYLGGYSGTVTINDTSQPNEVLTITPSSIAYPNPVRVDITGGVPNSRVYFSLDNTSYSGFVDLDASGNYTNTNAGPSEVVGSHTLYVRFNATNHYRQASWTVTAPAPTYSFSRDQSIVNEGGVITYTVNTTNVSDGTRIYWINYGSTDANDFTAFTNQGFVTINGNTGSFNRQLRNDATTEGTEEVWIFFYSDSGYNNYIGYTGQTTVYDTSTAVTYPASGTLLSQFCSGYTRYGTYADGSGGSYNQVIEYNAAYCGYTAPPAAGTLLSTFCSGTTKYGSYADGSGGSYNQVIATNSTECGYTPPAGQSVSGYSSATNDPGNVDIEGSPSAAYDGLRCRGVGRDNIDSYVQRTFTVAQAGTITGTLQVNSEANYDFGYLYFDGVEYAKGSGSYNSGPISGPITAGTHTVKVRYTKDSSISGAGDNAFGYWVIT